jgi:hypothetical protein
MEPEVFELKHISSNPIKEPEIQIRYQDGQLHNLSKEKIYNKLMTENLDFILKVSFGIIIKDDLEVVY